MIDETDRLQEEIGSLKKKALLATYQSVERIEKELSNVLKTIQEEIENPQILTALSINYWRIGENLLTFLRNFREIRNKTRRVIRKKTQAGFRKREPP